MKVDMEARANKYRDLLVRIADGAVQVSRFRVFKYQDTCKLANMVYNRFNLDLQSATAAWNRMMETNCNTNQFFQLISDYELLAAMFNA